MNAFQRVDACVASVMSVSGALDSEHTKARELIIEVVLPSGDKIHQIANPIKFSRTSQEYDKADVIGGPHTKEVILKLGYSEEEYKELEKKGVLV